MGVNCKGAATPAGTIVLTSLAGLFVAKGKPYENAEIKAFSHAGSASSRIRNRLGKRRKGVNHRMTAADQKDLIARAQ